MARVAEVLLSVPASSAVLERDFSTAGRLTTGSRSRLAGEYVEMTLFLNCNPGVLPRGGARPVNSVGSGGIASPAHQPQGRGGGPLYRHGGRRPRRCQRRQHRRRRVRTGDRLLRALEAFATHWVDTLGSRGHGIDLVILGRNTHPTPLQIHFCVSTLRYMKIRLFMHVLDLSRVDGVRCFHLHWC